MAKKSKRTRDGIAWRNQAIWELSTSKAPRSHRNETAKTASFHYPWHLKASLVRREVLCRRWRLTLSGSTREKKITWQCFVREKTSLWKWTKLRCKKRNIKMITTRSTFSINKLKWRWAKKSANGLPRFRQKAESATNKICTGRWNQWIICTKM